MSIYKIKIKPGAKGQPAVFEPRVLTANANDSVYWSNDDTQAHWPAPSALTPKAWLDYQIAPDSVSSQISLNPPPPYTLNYVCVLHPAERGQIKLGKSKKGAFGGKTKKGAFGKKTKKGAFGKITK